MSWIRETKLLQLVCALWNEVPIDTRSELMPGIEAAGLGWAIPVEEYITDDDWFTPQQLSVHLGLSESTIRNWPSRHGLKPNRIGQYRWGDVRAIREERARRHADRNVA